MLAIETSQRQGSVALRDARGEVHIEPLHEPTRYDDDLLPAIDRLTGRCGIAPRELSALAVSIGPGGFTGLRIAISTAKMIGEAVQIPLIAVPSAQVAAEAYRANHGANHGANRAEREAGGGTILVALASKRDTAWITRIVISPGLPAIHQPHSMKYIASREGLHDASTLDLAGAEAMLADEHFPAAMREACERAGVPIIPPTFDAAACLAVAQRMLDAGQVADALHLLPLYPREPEAVILWRQRQSKPPHG